MEVEAFRKIHPTEFYRKFILHNVRPDGRGLTKVRNTLISVGSITNAHGSAFVKIGNTSVMAGIKAEVGKIPSDHNPNTNAQIVVNVELLPLCSPNFKPGKPSEQAQQLSNSINTLLRTRSIVEPSTLVIGTGVQWYLLVDIYCLDYDGAVLDASLIALIAALQNVRLPAASITEDAAGTKVVATPERNISLELLQYPIASTFGIFDETYILTDPTAEEESLLGGELTIIYNNHNELCAVHKPGGSTITEEKMQGCIEKAKGRVAEVMHLLDEAASGSRQ